jgi:hypothetical protein
MLAMSVLWCNADRESNGKMNRQWRAAGSCGDDVYMYYHDDKVGMKAPARKLWPEQSNTSV